MYIGNKDFTDDHTYIMGILNVTPDSFSDGGRWNNIDAALKHTEQMLRDGAVIIDVGGESTRPGYTRITAEEEIARVVPVIQAIKKEFNVPVSVDTYKSKVAAAALSVGTDLINDIWGLKYDSQIAAAAKQYDVPVCIMHNRPRAVYNDFICDITADLIESIDIAKKAGIADDKLILDPGVGFAKSLEQNLQITKNIKVLQDMGYPVLLGVSRKSMIGLSLDLPKDERIEGTLACTVWACINRIRFVRVHDVKENYRAIKMTEAILNS